MAQAQETASKSTSLATLRANTAGNAPAEMRAGFETVGGFDLIQRGAKLLASSTIVPAQYRTVNIKKDMYGNITKQEENPSAISNCVVALNMAQRMGADPLMIMQNLYIVEGRPAWSSQYIIASINACGKYSPLRFKLEDLGEKEVEYSVTKWVNKQKTIQNEKVKIHDMRCIAWALEKKTGETLESPPVTIELAVKEGWYGKNGSKWQTMPEVMLRYRAASFFGKLYAPELLMGIHTAEEVHDTTFTYEQDETGTYHMTTEDIRAAAPEGQAQPASEAAKQPEEKNIPQRRRAAPKTKPAQEEALEPAAQPEPQPQENHDADTGEVFDDPFGGGFPESAMTVPCPKRGNQPVDELDCASCNSRQGCPSWE